MFSFEQESMLVEDREDLLAVLAMKYGKMSGEMIQEIYKVSDASTLQRLILVAANSSSFEVFRNELQEGEDSFRILGEDFNPLHQHVIGRDE